MTDRTDPKSVAPRFEPLVGQSGLHVYDPVEDVQAILFTDQKVTPTSANIDKFAFPVDSAIEITTTKLKTAFLLGLWIRDVEGNVIDEFDPDEGSKRIPAGDYLLEFTGMEMKTYARVETDGFSLTPQEGAIAIEFEQATKVVIGARSFHSQPARTLTTTDTPRDLMSAVSLFGNAMKTWSPERTFPSLRGHPPLLDIDDECQIPDTFSPPDTDIKIQVPAKHAWLYPTVPLAYWLGATVEPGDPVLLVNGKQYRIGREAGYESETEREAFENHLRDILQFTFLFDCAVRTEGFYSVELDARRRVESTDLPLDFASLYEKPLAERVSTYLEMGCSFQTIADQIGRPGWRLTADVQPGPDQSTILPFLARDLAVVRCPSPSRLEENSKGTSEKMEDVFARSSSLPRDHKPGRKAALTRSSLSPDSSSNTDRSERVIGLPDAGSTSQAWVGEGFAIGAAKASTRSYLQRLEKHGDGDSGIHIDVVVNDKEMADEASVSDIYGTRDYLTFDIQVQRDLKTEELATVFENTTDFVHYIGHVDPEGFDCSDGYLNANQLNTVGADTFFLNACSSYDQGQQLVDRGAIAGVATLEDVINSLATKVGKTVARLLNFGFPIGSATGLIQETIFTGSNYFVIGDSNAALAQSNVAVPNVARVSLRDDGLFDVSVEAFASWNFDVGSMYRPYLEGCDCNYIVPGELDTWKVNAEALDEYLDRYTLPVIGRGNLYWSDEITAKSLRKELESYC